MRKERSCQDPRVKGYGGCGGHLLLVDGGEGCPLANAWGNRTAVRHFGASAGREVSQAGAHWAVGEKKNSFGQGHTRAGGSTGFIYLFGNASTNNNDSFI